MVIRLFIASLFLFGLTASAQEASDLVVTWVTADQLFVWREGDDAPRQIDTPTNIFYPSPDGRHIAIPLWVEDLGGVLSVVKADTGDQQQIVIVEKQSDGIPVYPYDVAWADNSTLYLNTIANPDYGLNARDDLYRVDIQTMQFERIFPPGEGGRFTISPNGRWIAITYPGTYGNRDGRISVLNTATLERRDIFSFIGVSTGSEYRFYPTIYWQSDSAAFRVAIPDADLIYDEINKQTELWRMTIDGVTQQIGIISASFFGQPGWSDDSSQITYLRRVGKIEDNQFELIVANGNGENPITYLTAQTGLFEPPQWLPGTTLFGYTFGEPGTYWVGERGQQAQRFPNENEKAFGSFYADGFMVYSTTPSDGSIELRYIRLGETESNFIAAMDTPYPIFKAATQLTGNTLK
jgi:hypothetical protein